MKCNRLTRLVEELRLDQQRSWRTGNERLVESYVSEHPELGGDHNLLLDFIYGEYCLIEEVRGAVQTDDYYERFPQLAADLRPLFEVHNALNSEAISGRAMAKGGPSPHVATRTNCP